MPIKFLRRLLTVFTVAWATTASAAESQSADPSETSLRVAVIGGLNMSGVWPRLESAAEQALGLEIETVLAAPKERVVPAFQRGQVDALLMHGGDETFALEALGYGSALRTWGYNEFVIVGPDSDPAALASANTGVEAFLKLKETGAPLISFRDIASQQLIRRLLDNAGLYPRDINLIADSVGRPQQILQQVRDDQAYIIVGHLPVAFNRMDSSGTRIVLQGDASMRRGYVVVTPGANHEATVQARSNAERLADYLVSDSGQNELSEIADEIGWWILPRSAGQKLIDFEQSVNLNQPRRYRSQ